MTKTEYGHDVAWLLVPQRGLDLGEIRVVAEVGGQPLNGHTRFTRQASAERL